MTIRYSIIALFFATILTSCSSEQVEAETIPVEIQQTVETAEPTAPPIPSATPERLPDPVLIIAGDEEIVFDWTNDRCEPEHIPDLAARAFRDASGQSHLIISHYTNYQMLGPDLNNLTSDCSAPVLRSDYDPDPSAFNDAEWIASPYTEDGNTVYALIHNEYRGHTHPGKCSSDEYFDCLDTSITLAISTDGGMTFSDAIGAPNHLVATQPYLALTWEGPFGMRTPSNIIKGEDGYFYVFSNISEYETEKQWVCLMRSNDLTDPKSWRFWDGDSFEGQFINPYIDTYDDPKEHLCTPLGQRDIGASLNESITYNTYLERYVLIGHSADHIDGREVVGFYYSISEDLVNWTYRKLLLEIEMPWTVANPGRDVSHLYPTLIDPESASLNFDTAGKTAYLYFTRMNFGGGNLDRDLLRIPVEFYMWPEDIPPQ